MALKVSANFVVTEGPTSRIVEVAGGGTVTEVGYVVSLAIDGKPVTHTSNGSSRDLAIQGLRNWGFIVDDVA